MLIARRIPHGKAVFAACTLAAALFAAMSAIRTPAIAFALLACVGILGGAAISLIVTGLQENVDDAVRGRVLSMYTIISQVIPAVSGLAAGALTHALNAQRAVLICGAMLAIAVAFNGACMRTLRSYRGY